MHPLTFPAPLLARFPFIPTRFKTVSSTSPWVGREQYARGGRGRG